MCQVLSFHMTVPGTELRPPVLVVSIFTPWATHTGSKEYGLTNTPFLFIYFEQNREEQKDALMISVSANLWAGTPKWSP